MTGTEHRRKPRTGSSSSIPSPNTLQHVGQGQRTGPGLQAEREELPAARRVRLGSVQERQDRDSQRLCDHDRSADPWPGYRSGGESAVRFPGISFSPTAATPFVTLGNAFNSLASAAFRRHRSRTTTRRLRVGMELQHSATVRQRLRLNVGYYRQQRHRSEHPRATTISSSTACGPIPTLSANSPIDPGLPLGTINVYESDGKFVLQRTVGDREKRFSKGLQFERPTPTRSRSTKTRRTSRAW